VLALCNTETNRTAEHVAGAEADLAEQRAKVKLMEGSASISSPAPVQAASTVVPAGTIPPDQPQMSPTPAGNPASASPPPKDTQEYQALVARLKKLQQSELELQGKYTDASIQVKSIRSQIVELESQKSALEKKFPSLKVIGASQGNEDLGSERAKLAGMEAKAEMLKSQLRDIQERMKRLSDAGPEIVRLERTKEVEETNYKYFQGTLEKARVDEALDPSKMPNISAIQRPSPPRLLPRLANRIAPGPWPAVDFAWERLACSLSFFEPHLQRRSEIELQLRSPVCFRFRIKAKNQGHEWSAERLPRKNWSAGQ
jgi:hypothetical protein